MRNQRGQIAPLMVLSIIGITLLVFSVFNTGVQVRARIDAQNSVDAAALSQANLAARTLNVMAMNNTALTQAVVLNVVASAMVTATNVATIRATEKAIDYLTKMGNLPGFLLYIGPLTDLAVNVLVPLYRIQSINPNRIAREFRDISIALAEGNKLLVESYSKAVTNLDAALGKYNGPRESRVRHYMGYSASDDENVSLPVKLVGFDLPKVGGLCGTGEFGSPFSGIRSNFSVHGYAQRQGPYIIARKRALDKLETVERSLQRFPHLVQLPEFTKIRPLLDKLWPTACSMHTVFDPLYIGLPVPTRISLYALKTEPTPYLPWGDRRQDWSLLSVLDAPRSANQAIPAHFSAEKGKIVARAQAEIYSIENYDLYTQTWRARLVPARLITSEKHRDAIIEKFRDLPELAGVMRGVNETELEKVNVQ